MHRHFSIVCGLILLLAPFALLRAKSNRKAGPAIIAHLASEAVNAPQLSLRNEQGWDFLYVQSPTGDVTVLNVSHPNKPVVARKTSAADSGMKALSGSLALLETGAAPPAVHAAPASHKRFLDTSDPEHPRTIPELDGATSYALDRVRGLLFLSNAAGLWIVHDDGLVDPTVKMWEDFVKAP